MTLAICHQFPDRIILASDSRITYGNSHSDLAIKVIPITVKIDSPVDANSGQKATLFSSTYGIAFAGTFAAYNAISDFLSISLQTFAIHTIVW